MACLGCQLANGEIETQVVFENEWMTCFLDYNPYNEGHVLILPKRHCADITDFTQQEMFDLCSAIKILSKALNRQFTPDGITVMQNGGSFDDLTHVHVHLVPRYKGQNFADFFIENESDVALHADNLPITRQKLIETIKGLD